MRRRHLVLGGTGFLGLHLAQRLASALGPGDELVLVDDHSRGARDAEVGAFLAAHPTVLLVQADLTRPEAFAALGGAFTDVYLLAAIVGVRNAETRAVEVLRTNTLVVLNALEWMRSSGSRRLFYSSTSEVYAGGPAIGAVAVPTPESVPLVVEDIRNPRLSYAVSKLWGEAAVHHWARQHRFEAITGRYHNVYGPRMGVEHVIPELALRLLGGESPLRVRSLDQTRAFCYVDDAVEATLRLMDCDRAVGETVHIGNDREEVRIGELADVIMQAAGVRCAVEPLPPPRGSVHRRCPDIAKLRALTGYEPRVGLADGVRRTVAWYAAHRAEFAARVAQSALAATAAGRGP